jgi:hypothetical protein
MTAHYKSLFLAHQLSMFSALENNRVVKIVHSSSKVVSQTLYHTEIYPGSDLSSEVIVLRLAV